MKKTMWALLILLLALPGWAVEPDGSVTYTDEWTPGTHKGILMITCDDWAHDPFTSLADSLNFPMAFMLSGADNDTPAHDARRASAVAAWEAGIDIGVHYAGDESPNALVKDMTPDQKKAMFVNNIAAVQSIMGTTPGGPTGGAWTPQSFAYYGNDWTENALDIGSGYFTYQRGRYSSVDSAGVITTLYSPLMSHTGNYVGMTFNKIANAPISDKYGRGQSLVQTQADRHSWQQPFKGFASSAEAADDTTGAGAFLLDIVKYNLVSSVNIHPGGDASYQELMKLMQYALARGDIWITTPRKLMANASLAAAFNRGLQDTLYVATTGTDTGLGTWDDPTTFKVALQAQWTHPVKFKTDETYYVPTTIDAANDIVNCGAISVVGPSTLKFQLNPQGATDMTAALSAVLKADPACSTIDDDATTANDYTTGYRQTYKDLTFESHGNAYESSFPSHMIQVLGNRVYFEDCEFDISSKYAVMLTAGGTRSHFLRSYFHVDTTTAGCGGVFGNSTGATEAVLVGNLLKSTTGSAANTLVRWDTKVSASIPDTIANNIFWNAGTATTSNAVKYLVASSATQPYYNVYWGGNLSRFATGKDLKIQLKAGAVTWAVGNDSLMNYRITLHPAKIDSLKSWAVTYDPADGDTVRWGGLPLGDAYGTAERYGSIGQTQYVNTKQLFLWPSVHGAEKSINAVVGTPEYLLVLIRAGVLPPIDTLDIDTYYRFPIPRNAGEAETVRDYREHWNGPDHDYTDRQLLRFITR